MTDWMSREQRSRNMASIRSRGNTTTEAAFANLLRQANVSGWRRHLPLPGKPDFAFHRNRVAVFIDGCFWHGCPDCYRLPEDNRPYWQEKVRRNRFRDRMASRELRRKGWKVLRVWEHQLKDQKSSRDVLNRLRRLLVRRYDELSGYGLSKVADGQQRHPKQQGKSNSAQKL